MNFRRLSTAAVVLTLAAALTGCGSSSGEDGSKGTSSGVKLLSSAQVGQAVLTADDLGPGFKVDKSDDDDSKTSFGCLDSLSKLDKLDSGKFKPSHEKEIDYAADSEIGVPAVFTTVGTFKDRDTVDEAISTIKKSLEGCTAVDATDDEGFHVKLKVSVDDTAGEGATAQVNLTAVGTGETSGFTVPFGIRMTVIQVDNNVSLSALVAFGDDLQAEGDKVAAIALERLVDVVAGKTPSPSPADLHVTTEQEMMSGLGAQG